MGVVDSRYTGTFRAVATVQTTEEETNITTETEVVIYDNQPCRLVVESNPVTIDANGAPVVSQTITLLCSSDCLIQPGTKITVTQEGRTATFNSSGFPSVYPSHQEITLSNAERWA